MSRADIFMLNARQAARRTSASPADYACAVERTRARSDGAVKWALVAGFVAAICAAIFN